MRPSSSINVLLLASAADLALSAPQSAPQSTADTTRTDVSAFAFESEPLTDENIEQKLRERLPKESRHAGGFSGFLGGFGKLVHLLLTFGHAGCDVTSEESCDADRVLPASDDCKAFPGDDEWPEDKLWNALNLFTGGRLLQPIPQAHICYANGTGGTIDQAGCQEMTDSWTDPYFHMDDPIEVFQPLYQGMTCQPPSIFDESGLCTQGGYPVYTVNATSVDHIQLAVNIARNTGVRLVVKNTGHDYLGKSAGAGALSVWTHHLKDLEYIESFENSVYSGAAIKAGAGVQGFEMNEFAGNHNVIALTGLCSSVGIIGGWSQGGGHSPLNPVFGMGSDQLLSVQMVTADGRFITADADTNSDIFWAVRGGGGSTFGIVTSAVVKAYPEVEVTHASWSIATGDDVSEEQFREALRLFYAYYPTLNDNNVYSYFSIFGRSLSMDPFVAVNRSLSSTQDLLAPFITDLAALNITLEPEYTHFPTWAAATATDKILPAICPVNDLGVATASRLFPNANFATPFALNETFSALWTTLEAGHGLLSYNMAPHPLPEGETNALNLAWRRAAAFIITAVVVDVTASDESIAATRDAFTADIMRSWRDVTPGSGTYLNEADHNEPNWQWAFWGEHYERLLSIKRAADPWGVFYASLGVGAEFLEIRGEGGVGGSGENGRLCLNADPTLFVSEAI